MTMVRLSRPSLIPILVVAVALVACSQSRPPAPESSATAAPIVMAPSMTATTARPTESPATATPAPSATPIPPTATPSPSPSLTPSTTPTPGRTSEVIVYRARPGDTYSGIAAQADIDLGEMLALNELSDKNIIGIGQPIKLPVGARPPEQWPVPTPKPLPTFTTNIAIPDSPEIKLGRDDHQWIALTFDTGYNPEVQRQILAVLREYNVKATFLVVGSGVEQAPEVVKDVVADGHELGNHSFTHRDFLGLAPNQVLAELRDTEAAVKAVNPNVTTKPWFRAPFGNTNETIRKIVHDEGYYIVNWTVDSIDWVEGITADEVYWTIHRAIRPGAIIVEHGSSQASVEALKRLLPELIDQGYEFKTLSEILAP